MDALADRPEQRELRRSLRRSYGCDCNGDAEPGIRVDPAQTDGTLETVFGWTETRTTGCPWRSLRDPFVQRVHHAYRWFKEHQLATYVPRPSHRLITGITYLQTVIHAMDVAEDEWRKKNATRAQSE